MGNSVQSPVKITLKNTTQMHIYSSLVLFLCYNRASCFFTNGAFDEIPSDTNAVESHNSISKVSWAFRHDCMNAYIRHAVVTWLSDVIVELPGYVFTLSKGKGAGSKSSAIPWYKKSRFMNIIIIT